MIPTYAGLAAGPRVHNTVVRPEPVGASTGAAYPIILGRSAGPVPYTPARRHAPWRVSSPATGTRCCRHPHRCPSASPVRTVRRVRVRPGKGRDARRWVRPGHRGHLSREIDTQETVADRRKGMDGQEGRARGKGACRTEVPDAAAVGHWGARGPRRGLVCKEGRKGGRREEPGVVTVAITRQRGGNVW